MELKWMKSETCVATLLPIFILFRVSLWLPSLVLRPKKKTQVIHYLTHRGNFIRVMETKGNEIKKRIKFHENSESRLKIVSGMEEEEQEGELINFC